MANQVHHRVKGETSLPTAAVALMQKIGVTRAAKETGISTTALHKARKAGVISKAMELAAAHALEHLGDAKANPQPTPRSKPALKPQDTALFLLEVSAEKGPIVEQMARALGGELVAA